MPIRVRLILAAVFFTGSASVGEAKVHITVDLSRQTMHVAAANEAYDWKVSTGKFGFETPNGTYGVLWMDKDHLSQEYDNAPMPDAIFFRPGFAIHGAYKSDFGHPASHGCVRLPVDKAEILFDLVQAEGAEIKIVGGQQVETAATAPPPRRRQPAPDEDAMPDVYQNLMAQPRSETDPADLQSGYLRSPY
ncbi:MAG: L,D-transpeptidase [Beijerinckiaceae bacterium]|nr:L,D-transpeptidase [Beijerinckiaceae bacterium]